MKNLLKHKTETRVDIWCVNIDEMRSCLIYLLYILYEMNIMQFRIVYVRKEILWTKHFIIKVNELYSMHIILCNKYIIIYLFTKIMMRNNAKTNSVAMGR